MQFGQGDDGLRAPAGRERGEAEGGPLGRAARQQGTLLPAPLLAMSCALRTCNTWPHISVHEVLWLVRWGGGS